MPTSPHGTRDTTVTDATGAVWTLGELYTTGSANRQILVDGQPHAAGGYASDYLVCGGVVFPYGGGTFFQIQAGQWQPVGSDPPCAAGEGLVLPPSGFTLQDNGKLKICSPSHPEICWELDRSAS